jgi:molybdate transport system ATP-binding protein
VFSSGESLAVDFSLSNGDILHLQGNNASGKTTTFNLINGFLTPGSGRAVLNDVVLFDKVGGINIPVRHRHIARVFQNSYLFPNMSVKKNLDFANKNPTLLENLVKALDLTPLMGKFPAGLSGGQLQKVAIVQSLINNPQLLLLDEAFSNLDVSTKNIIKAYIIAAKIPVIITSHNSEDTDGFVNKVYKIPVA